MKDIKNIIVIIGIVILSYMIFSPWILGSENINKYTEVYFKDHTNLPSSFEGKDSIDVGFIIENKYSSGYRYTYEIYYDYKNESIKTDRKSVYISPNGVFQGSIIVNKNDIFDDSGPVKIVLKVMNTGQEIFFWID